MSIVTSGFSYFMNNTTLHDETLSFFMMKHRFTVSVTSGYGVLKLLFPALMDDVWTSLNPRVCRINLEVMEEYDLFFKLIIIFIFKDYKSDSAAWKFVEKEILSV